MKLSELPLCVECDKPVIGPETGRGPFYVVRTSLAIVNPKAASGVLGLITIMSAGRPLSAAALGIAEALAPDAEGFVMILSDEDKKLQTQIVVCQECFLMKGSMAMWVEKANRREEK